MIPPLFASVVAPPTIKVVSIPTCPLKVDVSVTSSIVVLVVPPTSSFCVGAVLPIPTPVFGIYTSSELSTLIRS